jgi:hypothetical protein
MALLKPSATKRKRSGERGKPCHRPLSEMKKGEAAPFIRITKENKEIHAIIHLMKGTSNPKCVSSSLIKDQFTRSKSFDRSIFKMAPLALEDLRLFRPSWATPMASWIWQPFRKTNFLLK